MENEINPILKFLESKTAQNNLPLIEENVGMHYFLGKRFNKELKDFDDIYMEKRVVVPLSKTLGKDTLCYGLSFDNGFDIIVYHYSQYLKNQHKIGFSEEITVKKINAVYKVFGKSKEIFSSLEDFKKAIEEINVEDFNLENCTKEDLIEDAKSCFDAITQKSLEVEKEPDTSNGDLKRKRGRKKKVSIILEPGLHEYTPLKMRKMTENRESEGKIILQKFNSGVNSIYCNATFHKSLDIIAIKSKEQQKYENKDIEMLKNFISPEEVEEFLNNGFNPKKFMLYNASVKKVQVFNKNEN